MESPSEARSLRFASTTLRKARLQPIPAQPGSLQTVGKPGFGNRISREPPGCNDFRENMPPRLAYFLPGIYPVCSDIQNYLKVYWLLEQGDRMADAASSQKKKKKQAGLKGVCPLDRYDGPGTVAMVPSNFVIVCVLNAFNAVKLPSTVLDRCNGPVMLALCLPERFNRAIIIFTVVTIKTSLVNFDCFCERNSFLLVAMPSI